LDATVEPQRWRPALLPKSRWARVSLLLVIVFALLRSVLWASVQPAWLAPDEDYHWLYVNYLVVRDAPPNLHGPFTDDEFNASVQLTKQGVYLAGPRHNYSGHPKAILGELAGLSRRLIPPDPRPVLEAPAYYVPAAIIDKLLWHKVSVTRLTAIRYYSALLGALTIYFAWLLAAQILAREWQQLAAAALASLQTILAFSASTVTNDAGVAVMLTATLAWCAWMLRAPPRARQGIGLGALLGLSLLTKATLFSLVIVVAATLALLWRAYPQARRALRGVIAWTVALPIVLAGWWYVYVYRTTHSITGELTGGSAPVPATHGPGILHAPAIAWVWFQQVYRNYWFSFLFSEVQANTFWFWVPLVGIVIVAAGLVLFLIRTGRVTLRPGGHQQRSVLVICLAALLLVGVPLGLDTWSAVHGGGFLTQQGRFMTPAYPGLAVIAVLAMGELTGRRRRLFPAAVAALLVGAFVLYWHTWAVWVLERFYGAADGHWLRELLHASYDKPLFITQDSLAALGVLAMAAFAAAFALTALAWGREQRAQRQGAPGLSDTARPVTVQH
jgi:hypothetical protein